MTGRILGIDHLGVAVRDPRQRLPLWAELLGLELERAEAVPPEGVRTWFLDAGNAHVELLEPLAADSPVGRHLEKRGEGIHHLCLRVDDLDAVLARLAARGIEPLGGGPRAGAGGARVAFLHPRDTGGVLLELSERPGGGEEKNGPRGLRPGDVVVLYLRDPKVRLVGLLEALGPEGVTIRGIDLEAFEDWTNQWARGEAGPLAPGLQFLPAHRVEKLLADQAVPGLVSLGEQFRERTGRELRDALAARDEGKDR